MIWIRPKRFVMGSFVLDQNILYQSKTIWTVQNHLGPIEGQGVSVANQFQINPQLMSHDYAKLPRMEKKCE